MHNDLRNFLAERLQTSIDECRNLLDRHGYMIEMHGGENYRTMVVRKTGCGWVWIEFAGFHANDNQYQLPFDLFCLGEFSRYLLKRFATTSEQLPWEENDELALARRHLVDDEWNTHLNNQRLTGQVLKLIRRLETTRVFECNYPQIMIYGKR